MPGLYAALDTTQIGGLLFYQACATLGFRDSVQFSHSILSLPEGE
jgi:hypothetical protein